MLAYLRRLAGSDTTPVLPARVRETIRSQQESSEVLIGWFQLAVVCTFAVLYFLSPKPYASAPRFAPEPWFIGAYFGFTVIRLVLAHRRRLPGALLHVSTFLDMALLLALIWSIHVKYGQPASFYLKVPTLLYVFIFISLRALRYEVRYVVLAGLVAAAGWLLMVWYVISVDPANPMITRDYVEYMTSNSVLLGAEFDKVISILMVTAILAVAIARARRLLVRAVAERAAARELSRFVPAEVARRVTSSEERPQAGQGEVREASVLFTDIEGFTAMSEGLDPPELIAVLNEYFSVVADPIARHGGVINQFQGDAILATFNIPEALDDHAAEAIRAAVEIQEALRERRFGSGMTIRSRVGINTGMVVGGLVGTADHLGYTVHGDAVNLAARLEQLNKELGSRVVVSARTLELAGDLGLAFRRIGDVNVRGRRVPAVVYALDADPPPPAPRP